MKLKLSQISVAALCCLFLSCSEHVIDLPPEKTDESSGNRELGEGSKATLHDFKPMDPGEIPDSDWQDGPQPHDGLPSAPNEASYIVGNLQSGNAYGTVSNGVVGVSFSLSYTRKANGTYDEPVVTANGPEGTTFTTKRAIISNGVLIVSFMGSVKITTRNYNAPPPAVAPPVIRYEYFSIVREYPLPH
ncbi:hypothetical protein [Sphingobacterium corticibacter]|uniref:Uncharacterized protein n=1 Tax=Sphingobacterium corticibacter TaxID=2171749 RepID=A0A2T8HNY9_9SPHI|nr:hypothetical protein [Sphingobacterium corticibacter]PVH27022.1 hypothetical protein DC487_05345 [Sphingobacterium corticibacter]